MGLSTEVTGVRSRLEQELSALQAAGIAVTSQTDLEGIPQWVCTLRHDEADVSVTVTLVDGFPWVPPIVTSDDPLIARHQVPTRGGAFCLDRSDAPWWHPEHTVAQLLQHLQALLDADSDGNASGTEADMPEPASAFLTGSGFPVVLIPATLLNHHLGATAGTVQLTPVDGPHAQWVVTRITSADGGKVKLSDETQGPAFKLNRRRRIEIPWRDIGELRDRPGVEAARRELLSMAPGPRSKNRDRRTPHGWRAVTFMEEGPTRTQTRRAWAFADVRGTPLRPASTQALAVEERSARRTDLRGLSDARVTIFGVGSIGSSIAFSLAQAGITDLQLVDDDTFDVNNGVRHILPAAAAGQRKATALAAFLNGHQPFCRATGHVVDIGHTAGSVALATELIGGSGLVIDATGAPTISRLLGHIAAQNDVPLIHSALLAGGDHGYVFVRRKDTGCIDHFLAGPTLPLPPTSTVPNATPYGCSHPAVSCAPFEPAEIAIHAARIAAQILPSASYRSFDHDWLILQLIDRTSAHGSTPKHADCAYCTA